MRGLNRLAHTSSRKSLCKIAQACLHFLSSSCVALHPFVKQSGFLSLELSLNRGLQALGLGGASPSALNLAILANQELLKVPLDSLQPHDTGLLGLHPLENGLGLVAVDVGFAENRE